MRSLEVEPGQSDGVAPTTAFPDGVWERGKQSVAQQSKPEKLRAEAVFKLGKEAPATTEGKKRVWKRASGHDGGSFCGLKRGSGDDGGQKVGVEKSLRA